MFRNNRANTFIDFLSKNNNYKISPFCAIENFFLKEQIFKKYKLYITRQFEKYCKQK